VGKVKRTEARSEEHLETLAGWGKTAPSVAEVADPTRVEQLAELVTSAGPRGVIARGLGRSYGDPAQNGGGRVIRTTGLDKILSVDVATGRVTAQSGVSLHKLMATMLPLGWFVPVTPGTRYVTVGGAIGCDIHGKNHHSAGSFCQHVESFELMGADGQIRTVTPESEPDLFWATAGGMGLTGIVVSATIRFKKVETARIKADIWRAPDLDGVMAELAATDDKYPYTVAWIDCLATGRNLGRSVLTCGDFAKLDEVPSKVRRDPLKFSPMSLGTVPPVPVSGLLNKVTGRAFNEMWFRKAPVRKEGIIQGVGAFFHPLDGIMEWNRVYGPAGFLQWQFVVPFGAEDTLRAIVERISAHGAPAALTVLKRFGAGNSGHLSFPTAGWTLALDFPTRVAGLAELLDGLDEAVLNAGGRLYLAKDSRMRPELLAEMYPRLEEFRKLRAEIDPHQVFTSDQARRLRL
jgi:decaprenylphospho-beta-D-ribofuranose 2-oxidase